MHPWIYQAVIDRYDEPINLSVPVLACPTYLRPIELDRSLALVPPGLHQRIELLIDDLIEAGNLTTASLASIFVAAQEAVAQGNDVALCRHVWSIMGGLNPAEPLSTQADKPVMSADQA